MDLSNPQDLRADINILSKTTFLWVLLTSSECWTSEDRCLWCRPRFYCQQTPPAGLLRWHRKPPPHPRNLPRHCPEHLKNTTLTLSPHTGELQHHGFPGFIWQSWRHLDQLQQPETVQMMDLHSVRKHSWKWIKTVTVTQTVFTSQEFVLVWSKNMYQHWRLLMK